MVVGTDHVVCTDHNSPGSRCTMECIGSDQKRVFECAGNAIANSAGFWNDSILDCVGKSLNLLLLSLILIYFL